LASCCFKLWFVAPAGNRRPERDPIAKAVCRTCVTLKSCPLAAWPAVCPTPLRVNQSARGRPGCPREMPQTRPAPGASFPPSTQVALVIQFLGAQPRPRQHDKKKAGPSPAPVAAGARCVPPLRPPALPLPQTQRACTAPRVPPYRRSCTVLCSGHPAARCPPGIAYHRTAPDPQPAPCAVQRTPTASWTTSPPMPGQTCHLQPYQVTCATSVTTPFSWSSTAAGALVRGRSSATGGIKIFPDPILLI